MIKIKNKIYIPKGEMSLYKNINIKKIIQIIFNKKYFII